MHCSHVWRENRWSRRPDNVKRVNLFKIRRPPVCALTANFIPVCAFAAYAHSYTYPHPPLPIWRFLPVSICLFPSRLSLKSVSYAALGTRPPLPPGRPAAAHAEGAVPGRHTTGLGEQHDEALCTYRAER